MKKVVKIVNFRVIALLISTLLTLPFCGTTTAFVRVPCGEGNLQGDMYMSVQSWDGRSLTPYYKVTDDSPGHDEGGASSYTWTVHATPFEGGTMSARFGGPAKSQCYCRIAVDRSIWTSNCVWDHIYVEGPLCNY